jgi:hypothetical protein
MSILTYFYPLSSYLETGSGVIYLISQFGKNKLVIQSSASSHILPLGSPKVGQRLCPFPGPCSLLMGEE